MKISNVFKNDKIAVAVSGGKDSMCLLTALINLKTQLNLQIIAINVDHSIRGEESQKDSLFVKDFCKKHGIKLFFKKVDAVNYSLKNSLSVEQGARVLRYEFFKEVLSKNEGFVLATAHHKTDNFETVLLNVLRGTGIKGLGGIKQTNVVIRPLLTVAREEIDSYAIKNNVPFREDSTNKNVVYTRNFIRNVLTPLILEKFPDAISSVERLSKTATEEDEFLDSLAKKELKISKNKVSVSVDLPSVLFKRAVILAFKELGATVDYEKIHIDSVFNLINLENGKSVNLLKGLTAVREYNVITIYNGKDIKQDAVLNFSVGELFVNGKTIVITTEKPAVTHLTFDGDKIPQNSVIRSRQTGDVFTKFGGGSKKLKDYFIDKKIPVKQRNDIPIIASGNNVLVILGVEISEQVKVTDKTKNVLYAYIKN